MKFLLLIVLLMMNGWASAETDPRLARLEAAFNRIHQEQQATHQQFLMAQELRRNELQESPLPGAVQGYSAMGVDSTRPIDYDENLRLQRQRQERLQRYDQEIRQSYARFLELGTQKKTLLEQIKALEAVTKP